MCSAKVLKSDRDGKDGKTIGDRLKRSLWSPIPFKDIAGQLAKEGYNIYRGRPTSGPWIRDPEGYQKQRSAQINSKGSL